MPDVGQNRHKSDRGYRANIVLDSPQCIGSRTVLAAVHLDRRSRRLAWGLLPMRLKH